MIKLSKQANKLALCSILLVFILVFILGSLDLWGISFNKDLIDFIKTVLLTSLPFLGYWAAIKLVNPKDIIDVKLLLNTKKIRVNFYTTKGLIERNNQISFVRFFFGNEVLYMYFTNFIGIYDGPYYIKKENQADLDMFYIKSLSDNRNGEIIMEIKPKSSLNPSYKLVLKNITKSDHDLILKNINIFI